MSNDSENVKMPSAGETSSERLTGRVKWFNNRAGFGFVTVMEGDKRDEDVFVHHSGIVVNSEQYKYLVQGEYVSFVLRESDNEEHPYQAGDVKGVLSGWLMCETRNANRSARNEEGDEDEDSSQRRRPRRQNNGRSVRPRGSGPRESGGGGPNDEWVLTRRRQGNNRRGQNSQ
jgi:cold shock CspA family protein